MSRLAKMSAPLQASKLQIQLASGVSAQPPKNTLKFGHAFTDHMLEVDWDKTSGWDVPKIKPFANLSLHPAVTSLHYGLQVFEGMKAFRSVSDGEVRIFRPNLNMDRMLRSCERITLPSFDPKELEELIHKLVAVDKDWCPEGDGYSLYIRPTCISTEDTLGVAIPGKAKIFVILSPVGPYFASGFKPIQLLADTKYVRCFPGGPGDCKLGGNYAPTIMPQREAAAQGYTNLLWLLRDGDDFQVTECGAMNIFMLWVNENGEKELVTPPLDMGVILPGVTRASLLELARKKKDIKVCEKQIYMKRDVVQGIRQGRVLEVFCCGTAVTVCSVDKLHFEGEDLNIPVCETKGIGELAEALRNDLYDIQYGRVSHEWESR